MTCYFVPNIAVYEDTSNMWLENQADLFIFRQYQRSLFQQLFDEGAALSSESHFVYIKEVIILNLCQ